MSQKLGDPIAHWQRLRNDPRSNIAAGLLIVAGLCSVLSVVDCFISPGSSTDRGNPLYWALIVPFAWWASALAGFTPSSIRNVRVAWLTVPVISGLALACHVFQQRAVTLATFACIGSVVGAGFSWFAYRGSVVDREGPDRRSAS